MNEVTKEMLESQIQQDLTDIKSAEDADRKNLVTEVCQLIDKLEAGEKLDADVVKAENDVKVKDDQLSLQIQQFEWQQQQAIQQYEWQMQQFMYQQAQDKLQYDWQQQQAWAAAIEQQKRNRLDFIKEVLTKVVAPLVIGGAGIYEYRRSINKAYECDEQGFIPSGPGKQVKIGDILKITKIW